MKKWKQYSRISKEESGRLGGARKRRSPIQGEKGKWHVKKNVSVKVEDELVHGRVCSPSTEREGGQRPRPNSPK